MHIGLLIYGSLETISGGYLFDRQLVSYLEAQGDQVDIISIPWRNYPLHLLDNLSRGFYRKLVNLPVDILLQDELSHPSLFHLNRGLKKKVNYRLISIVHHLRCSEFHPSWQNEFYSTVEKLYLQSVDGFIFNSQNTRQKVENLVGDQKSRVVAYPAGDRFQPDLAPGLIESRAQQDIPLQILFLGNVIPRKGLHTLLEALKLISIKNWQLSIAGSMAIDEKYAQRMMQSVRDYRIEDKVIFYGSLGEKELRSVMLTSHIMVMPSYHEGFGIAYLEGMGFGLPAIATTAGGSSEFITHNVNGYLIPQEDAAIISKYIARLTEDRHLLIKMSRSALERYHQHPTWENTSERIRGFLEKMIDQEDKL
jgi:glycosyltransferase involved in cell wall biosynthesis